MLGHRKPTRTDVITEYRRDALLTAAVRVFGEQASMPRRWSRSRAKRTSPRARPTCTTRSKQSIYDSALSHGLAELDARTDDAIRQALNLHEAIPAFVTARAQYFFEHRDFFRMYVAAIARQVTSVKPRWSGIPGNGRSSDAAPRGCDRAGDRAR